MRKGITGLAAAARQVLNQNPCSGAVFAFRGRRADRIKLLHWDGPVRTLLAEPLQRR
jgi:transposase